MDKLDDEKKNLLIKIITKYKKIIENKQTDSVANKSKNYCWSKITNEFNAQSIGQDKTKKQIISAYNNMKGKLRRECSKQKNEIRQTGGGPFKYSFRNEADGELFNLIAPTIEPLRNPCDSDGIQRNEEEETEDIMQEEYLDEFETLMETTEHQNSLGDSSGISIDGSRCSSRNTAPAGVNVDDGPLNLIRSRRKPKRKSNFTEMEQLKKSLIKSKIQSNIAKEKAFSSVANYYLKLEQTLNTNSVNLSNQELNSSLDLN